MKKLFNFIKIFFYSLFFRISIALYNVNNEIFKLDLKNGKEQKKKHDNKLIQKLLDGIKDEKFVKDYYEILKKADKYMKEATPEKIAMSADKWGMNFGKKDKWGRRYEHLGFFDPSNKNYGKTLGEALQQEVEERKTKDDDYPVEFMFDNFPIDFGFTKINELKKNEEGYEALNEYEKSKVKEFPLRVNRDDENILNKIEQLTEHLHIKKVVNEKRILEFFIPKKYKVFDYSEDSNIFKEIIDIKQVWIKDEYHNLYGYTIDNYYKRIDYDERFIVIKFKGNKINKIN